MEGKANILIVEDNVSFVSLTAKASRGTVPAWPWLGLVGLAMLAKGHIRRAARKISY